jgi:hypothetical protein
VGSLRPLNFGGRIQPTFALNILVLRQPNPLIFHPNNHENEFAPTRLVPLSNQTDTYIVVVLVDQLPSYYLCILHIFTTSTVKKQNSNIIFVFYTFLQQVRLKYKILFYAGHSCILWVIKLTMPSLRFDSRSTPACKHLLIKTKITKSINCHKEITN